MKSTLLMILAVFICSACASSEPKTDVNDLDLDNAVTENGERLYCKRERVTGTHRVTTTCLTEAEKSSGTTKFRGISQEGSAHPSTES